MTYVIGHKNPDTDAIVSSIVNSHIRKSLGDVHAKPIKLGEINNETKFVLDYWKAEEPELTTFLEEGTEVALVDHNESSQSIDNIENLKIISIIDHHKFNLQTSEPLHILALPLGSTASILAEMMLSENIEISKQHAGLLISAIISDTLFFRSPTTTEKDKEICQKLNQIAQIEDLEKYSLEMFNAKSDLGDMDIQKIITLDYKEFNISNKKIGVGVMETTNPAYGLNRKEEIIANMQQIKKDTNLDHMLFCIVDILAEKNIGIAADQEDINFFKECYQTSESNNEIDLKNFVSRKKQLIPALENFLN